MLRKVLETAVFYQKMVAKALKFKRSGTSVEISVTQDTDFEEFADVQLTFRHIT